MVLLLVIGAAAGGCGKGGGGPAVAPPSILEALLALSPAGLATVDIARLNLACAQGLPGNEETEIDSSLAQLGTWAARVKAETERHRYRFVRDPGEFEHSEGFFKMLMLGVVLTEAYLESLPPAGELAVFLSVRAMCLREAGRLAEAGEAFGKAAQLAPGVASYGAMATRCREEAGQRREVAQTRGGL